MSVEVEVVELIRQSRAEDCVVRVPWSEPLAAALSLACDGETDAGGEAHYWGSDWRVHLVIGVAS